jgi:hypothetical protein
MAYPIQLFDFQTEQGRSEGTKFLQSLDKTVTELFGIIQPGDKVKEYHKWTTDDLPEYLKQLGTQSIQQILKQVPEGDMKWTGNIGVFGRKTGTTIKKQDNVLYRIIINIGNPEIYYLQGENFNDEPAVLPNGYALLCSPIMIDKIDIKVKSDPIRKGLKSSLVGVVPKIRSRKYLRSTIVLDLPADGIEVSDVKEASLPKKE